MTAAEVHDCGLRSVDGSSRLGAGRKQGCIIPEEVRAKDPPRLNPADRTGPQGKPCTNCAIASQPCSFDVPVESRPAAVARERGVVLALCGASPDARSAGTSQTSIPTPAPAPPDPYYVPWVPPPHIPAVQSFAGRPSSLSNLLSASLSAISGAPSQEPRHSPELVGDPWGRREPITDRVACSPVLLWTWMRRTRRKLSWWEQRRKVML